MKRKRRQQLIPASIGGGFILLLVICGGLGRMGEQPVSPAKNAKPTGIAKDAKPTGIAKDAKPTGIAKDAKPGSRYKLTGTITKLDSNVRFSGSVTFNITIEHNGIPGVLSPGQQRFYACALPPGNDGGVEVTNLDMNKAVGQKVDFVVETPANQWDNWGIREITAR